MNKTVLSTQIKVNLESNSVSIVLVLNDTPYEVSLESLRDFSAQLSSAFVSARKIMDVIGASDAQTKRKPKKHISKRSKRYLSATLVEQSKERIDQLRSNPLAELFVEAPQVEVLEESEQGANGEKVS